MDIEWESTVSRYGDSMCKWDEGILVASEIFTNSSNSFRPQFVDKVKKTVINVTQFVK